MYRNTEKKPLGKPLVCHDLICQTETVAEAISLQYTFYIWGVPVGLQLTTSSGSCSFIVVRLSYQQASNSKS